MVLVNILHMNIGDGESSYANNSMLQKTGIQEAVPFLRHSIRGLANYDVFKDYIIVADLGCSSSTNTLLVASNIIDIVHEVCQENNRKPPQFQKEKGESFGPCVVSAVPGTFYDRLFLDKSLHIVHSANSNHWLSEVPQGLENNGSNIYITKTSPPNVYRAYGEQFHTDFTSTADPTTDDCCALLELLGQSLINMMKEGLVRESDINSFNVPVYFPCEHEVRNAIEYDGSFSLENMNFFKVNWDPHDTDYTNMNDSLELSQIHGENASKLLRAVLEPLLVSHFGNSIIDVLFGKFGKHVGEYLLRQKTRYFFTTISLIKK
ncbi:hypothetical protein M8C21_003291 [Ambrosia artemisiifolia]|uniref:Uncharacterized protein n=1 Tax=Ambrosia artemisiifolia TaxID=4212 RepID=A0AAD5BL96_AMBAR|nr:hypothetical protein M8C21_003291 [Ambrosia artemisiifolia]